MISKFLNCFLRNRYRKNKKQYPNTTYMSYYFFQLSSTFEGGEKLQ
jgi:hypothetical protein